MAGGDLVSSVFGARRGNSSRAAPGTMPEEPPASYRFGPNGVEVERWLGEVPCRDHQLLEMVWDFTETELVGGAETFGWVGQLGAGRIRLDGAGECLPQMRGALAEPRLLMRGQELCPEVEETFRGIAVALGLRGRLSADRFELVTRAWTELTGNGFGADR